MFILTFPEVLSHVPIYNNRPLIAIEIITLLLEELNHDRSSSLFFFFFLSGLGWFPLYLLTPYKKTTTMPHGQLPIG